MTAHPAADPTWRGAVRQAARWVLGSWPRRITFAVILIAPTAVVASEGMATVELPPPPQVQPGQTFDLGPADVQVQSFFVSDQVLTHSLPDDAQAWVGVIVDLHLQTAEGWNLPNDVVAAPGLAAGSSEPGANTAGFDQALITSDDSLLVRLEPSVPQQVVLLFPVADAGTVADTVELDLHSLYQMRSFLEGSMRWWTGEVAAEVAVPRDDQVPPALIEEDRG